MGKLLAAVNSINITPPLGITLTGYQERDKGAAGIKDELFAKVLVLDDGQEKLVMVCTDLSGVGHDLTQSIRKIVEENSDIKG